MPGRQTEPASFPGILGLLLMMETLTSQRGTSLRKGGREDTR